MTVKSVYAEAWTLQNDILYLISTKWCFLLLFFMFYVVTSYVIHSGTISFLKISYYVTQITHYS